MTDLPTIKMMPYSQKPTWLGIQWEIPSEIDVDHYMLVMSPKNIGSDEFEPLLTGARVQEGVVRVVLTPDIGSAVDNVTPQGKRTFYTVLAVGKDGGYHSPKFKINESTRMDLKAPKYLKEPYAPATLKIIPYGQRPGGIGITWTPPDGDWASFKVVVIKGKNINRPEDFERLFAGELDFADLYEVGTDINEVIDDATPEGTRSYYSVVAKDKRGNMVQVDAFKVMEASRATFADPLRLSGKGPAAAAPRAGKVEARTKAAPPAPGPTPKARAKAPTPGSKYPSRLSPMPATQHLYGLRIRFKEHSPDLVYRVLVSSKSITKAQEAIEGELDHVQAFDVPSDATEFLDNITGPGTRCYYVVLGQDAGGNFVQIPIEVKKPSGPALGEARYLDPGKGWATPTVDANWLLKTTEKGIELVPGAIGDGGTNRVDISSTQPWEGARIRITKPHENYVRYQLLVSADYIKVEGLVQAARGGDDRVRSLEVPTDALELIDNISEEGGRCHYALLGWDKEGNSYFVMVEFPSTMHAGFSSPRFIDPDDLGRVKAAADEKLEQGRALLEDMDTAKEYLDWKGQHNIEEAGKAGAQATLVYPMYDAIPPFFQDLKDKEGWLAQVQAQAKCVKLFEKAEECLKGDRQPYAYPDYGGVEGGLKEIGERQTGSKALLQDHIKEAPWSGGRGWYKERLAQFDTNDGELKRIEEHMAELKARDKKAKDLYDQAKEAHGKKDYDEAIRLYGEVTEVKPEWDTSGDIEGARDDKEFDGQMEGAGKDLAKFKAIYDDWMERGKGSYGWKALRKAYQILEDKDSFLLYERELYRHGAYDDVVGVWRECRETRPGFLQGIFGEAKVKDLGLKMEETDSEIRRINEEIRDQRQAMDEIERERMKFVGTDAHDHIRKLDADIDRRRRDISRDNERMGELIKKMALMLGDLFGEG